MMYKSREKGRNVLDVENVVEIQRERNCSLMLKNDVLIQRERNDCFWCLNIIVNVIQKKIVLYSHTICCFQQSLLMNRIFIFWLYKLQIYFTIIWFYIKSFFSGLSFFFNHYIDCNIHIKYNMKLESARHLCIGPKMLSLYMVTEKYVSWLCWKRLIIQNRSLIKSENSLTFVNNMVLI